MHVTHHSLRHSPAAAAPNNKTRRERAGRVQRSGDQQVNPFTEMNLTLPAHTCSVPFTFIQPETESRPLRGASSQSRTVLHAMAAAVPRQVCCLFDSFIIQKIVDGAFTYKSVRAAENHTHSKLQLHPHYITVKTLS